MNSEKWVDRSAPYLQPVATGQGDAWSREASRMGRDGGQRLLFAGETAAPERVARAMAIAPGGVVALRSRLIIIDGRPVELARSYYPTAIAAGTALVEPRKIQGGAVRVLAELGFVARRADEEVEARPASHDEAEILDLPTGEWVLDVFRTMKDRDGRLFEVTSMIMRACGRTLAYTTEIG